MNEALTNENYYSRQWDYMSASQYKDFLKCPARALAKLKKEWKESSSTALMVGSYVDAYFEGTIAEFKESHPEIFNKRDGSLKADYVHAENIIKRIERDDYFMAHMEGEKQKIMTGEIGGVQFKIKMDVFAESGMVVDLKVVRDFQWVFDEECRKRVPFVEYWGYDIQGATYQEIVRQNTGAKLPFFIAAATKEKEPDIALISIPQPQLDLQLGRIKKNAPLFQKIKKEAEDATRCGKCDYCKNTKVLSSCISYEQLGV